MTRNAAPLLSLRSPGQAGIERVIQEQRKESCAYPEVGAARSALPAGYRHITVTRLLGVGDEVFVRAAERLQRWEVHRGAGVTVHPAAAPVEVGATVVLVARLGPLRATVACRIVCRIDLPERAGFSYGTLPHHVVRGEEAFLVTRDAADRVQLQIRAFVRPRPGFLQLLGPAILLADRLLVQRYSGALHR